jgi:hypothetical protein
MIGVGRHTSGYASGRHPRRIHVVDFYRVVVPSILVGALMVMVNIYATPWFSSLWWVLHPAP